MRNRTTVEGVITFALIVLAAAALAVAGYFVFEHKPAPPERTECVVISHTDLTDSTREALLGQGWIPTDSQMYSPGCIGEPPCDFIDAEDISVTVAEQLVADGWYGDPSDGAERLYSPGCRDTLDGITGGGAR